MKTTSLLDFQFNTPELSLYIYATEYESLRAAPGFEYRLTILKDGKMVTIMPMDRADAVALAETAMKDALRIVAAQYAS